MPGPAWTARTPQKANPAMTRPATRQRTDPRPKSSDSITTIQIAGFKSIADPISIDIRPLTILAGANSAGKSSLLQPLLLLKQTLEASYDPGSLLIFGPNVKYTSLDQIFSKIGSSARAQ